MKPASAHRPSAFTLIELLVVIAIIALLISILLPSLASARGVARQIVGAAIQKNLGVAQAGYMNTYKDQYAGVNTSGAFYAGVTSGVGPNMTQMVGDTASHVPTSTCDWIAPSLGDGMELPPNRAQRTQRIFNTYRDPSARYDMGQIYTGGGGAPDLNDFRSAFADGGFKQTSFLSPSAFHYLSWDLGPQGPYRSECPKSFLVYHQTNNYATPANTPRNFRPRLELVGIQPSVKAMIMDGTRYYSGTEQVLDFDPAWNGLFSSYLDPGPTLHVSAAYGRDPASGAGGNGWKFSFRHPGKSFNVTMFDGHTELMKDTKAYTEYKYWYPSGSVVNSGGAATPEAAAKYPDGTIID